MSQPMLGSATVEMSAWVRINGGVDIEYHVYSEGDVEFTVGGRTELGLHVTPEGLEALVREASAALAASREVLTRGPA